MATSSDFRTGRIVALALVAALGFGVVGATAAKPKKVSSKVTIAFDPQNSSDPYDPYAESSFEGRVTTNKRKKKCKKGRRVTVKEIGAGKVGRAKTGKKGKYDVSAGDVLEPGEYEEFSSFYAQVKRKRKGNTICKKAKSPIIVAP
jgi:hypothetical protein